jgi:hypothetical protein
LGHLLCAEAVLTSEKTIASLVNDVIITTIAGASVRTVSRRVSVKVLRPVLRVICLSYAYV